MPPPRTWVRYWDIQRSALQVIPTLLGKVNTHTHAHIHTHTHTYNIGFHTNIWDCIAWPYHSLNHLALPSCCETDQHSAAAVISGVEPGGTRGGNDGTPDPAGPLVRATLIGFDQLGRPPAFHPYMDDVMHCSIDPSPPLPGTSLVSLLSRPGCTTLCS